MIFGELTEEEKALIEEKLIETYKNKNINFNDESLYEEKNNKKEFKKSKKMPKLEDLYNVLGKDKRTESNCMGEAKLTER